MFTCSSSRFRVSLQKPKDALCVFNTFSVKDLIAFPKEINRKLLLSIPFRYRYGIILFQQQRYRLILCTAACIIEGGVIGMIDSVESHCVCIKSDQDCTTLGESWCAQAMCNGREPLLSGDCTAGGLPFTISLMEPKVALLWSTVCKGSCPLPSGVVMRRWSLARRE